MATRRGVARRPVPKQPEKKKRGGGAVVAVAGVAVGAGVLWWLLSRMRGGGGPPLPPPANPVVNVGNDQAVTLDATSQAEITITFSVVADNPVNLTWSRPSGPASVIFSILGPNQEMVQFTTPGTYIIRLTATDTTDSQAKGFDEMVVTVNQAPLAAILVPGELKVDGFATYTLTRAQGQTISFIWPVKNIGSLAGAAFIQLTEAGSVVGTGAAFPIDPGETVNLNFNPVISLAAGVHILAAKVMEGLPPSGVAVGSAQIITLTVTSVAVLAPSGLPTINGIVGATQISLIRGQTASVIWPCQNSGGGAGQARLRLIFSPVTLPSGVQGALVTVPGFSTVALLLAFGTVSPFLFSSVYTVNLAMLDDTGLVLGTYQFVLSLIGNP